MDETITWFVSSQPLVQLARNSAHIDAMFLPYYLFIHFWLGASQALWWMRLPSLLAGAAAVQAFVLLVRRWLPLGWSVLAGFLLALNSLFAAYTIQARPYTALTLFAILSTAALVNAVGRGGRHRWALYGIASLCMLLTHLLAVFVLAAHLAAVAAVRRRSALAGMVPTIACVVVAVSPLAVLNARETQEGSWIAPSTYSTFHEALAGLIGGRSEKIALVICGIIVTVILARTPRASDRALGFALGLAWAAVPPLLLALAGFLQPIYVSRYVVAAVPGIALVEALAGWRISTFLAAKFRTRETLIPGTTYIMTALICGMACVPGLALLHSTSNAIQVPFWSEDYRAAAVALDRDISEHPAPIAVITNIVGVGVSYYAAPRELAHAIKGQEIREYNRHHIDYWGRYKLGSLVVPHEFTNVVNWPLGARPGISTTRCPAGWAIGRAFGPSNPFLVDGASCRVRSIRYFGSAWVASLSG